MQNLQINLKYSKMTSNAIMSYVNVVNELDKKLRSRADDEKEFLGWLKLPQNYNKREFDKIKRTAEKIRRQCEVFIVIGIGGSYLGARAVIDSLKNNFYNMQDESKRNSPQILFAGNNLSGTYLEELVDYVSDKDFAINVISKSGTTTEPAIAFRVFREVLEQKYGIDEARKRIYVTTDKEKGVLRKLATTEKYETFVIPNNIGGRYSVLTPVGLLPIAVAGINIDELMSGAAYAMDKYADSDLRYNVCYQYAVTRNILLKNNKNIEIFATYEPKLHFFIEWLKQLFGESEGKNGVGIYPTGAEFTTDLHSLGQYIQEGRRNLFETVIYFDKPRTNITIKEEEGNLDGLNYLAGKTINDVNEKAMQGTVLAHYDGDVPNIQVLFEKLCPESIGHMIYFFELACAMSASILGVDPFNQPGVEKYKTNMFKLLGKPGVQ